MWVNTVWIIFMGCTGIVASSSFEQLPFNLPSIIHVRRNWYVMSSDPIGTIVTRVRKERNENSTYGLETNGPPVPFTIDPHTGVVSVNDTLTDKENNIYSLWVTSNGGSLPQRTEVVATVTDRTGVGPKIPFPIPNLPPLPSYPTTPLEPKFTSTESTTKANVSYTKGTVTDTTKVVTPSPATKPEDVPEESKTSQEENRSNITVVDQPTTNVPLLAIIPPIVIGGLGIIVAAIMIYVLKKKSAHKWIKKQNDDLNKDSSCIVLQDASLNMWDRPRAYSNRYESWDANHLQLSQETSTTKKEPHDEWEFPRHRLRIFNIVGEGAFGQVYRAQAIDIDGIQFIHRKVDVQGMNVTNRVLGIGNHHFSRNKGETTVAVKTLKENASQDEKTDLIKELNLMKSLGTHPNVVRLIACCTEKEPTLVIMEFVSLGKLQQYLRDSRAERHYGNTHGDSQFLTSSDLTRFAYQVARGMDFLSSKGIIHRDLAARNVLITEERTCKVADFGFARDVAGTHVYERKSGGRLPIRWMAPESLYDDIFSVKSDIWSFGVLLWEIVTLGSTPYPGLSAGEVMQKVRDGHRLEKPEHCRRELYNIMYYCWEAQPTSRPDFKEVVTMLERLLCTETDYIELERFPDHSYYNVQHLDGEKL